MAHWHSFVVKRFRPFLQAITSVLIGKVVEFTHNPGDGLGYVGGSYFSLGLEREIDATVPTICGAIIEANGKVLLDNEKGVFSPVQIAGAELGGTA